jgi:hypothetical protein
MELRNFICSKIKEHRRNGNEERARKLEDALSYLMRAKSVGDT